ncbi:MAG: phage terminase large subunit family protein [Magnetospirillum sp. WYHS-4]
MTISAWADAERRLSSEASAEPGRWRTERAEYQRGIMDAVSDPMVETVVIMSSAQVGKALALDTPIPTPEGWTTMGNLRPGDRVPARPRPRPDPEGDNRCPLSSLRPPWAICSSSN